MAACKQEVLAELTGDICNLPPPHFYILEEQGKIGPDLGPNKQREIYE